jgi:hypothetical protein
MRLERACTERACTERACTERAAIYLAGQIILWLYSLNLTSDSGPAADATNAPQPWGLLCNPVMKMISFFFFVFPSNGAPVEWNWQGKTEVLGGEKPVPVPLCPPKIPHGLTQDRTRASAVRFRRLTAWAMARPYNSTYTVGFFVRTNSESFSVFLVTLYMQDDNFQFACELHSLRLPAWLTVNKRADVRFVIKFKFLEHDPIPR